MDKKIMFAGPSGIGKTTLANMLAEKLDIPFISGSYSDLIVATKELKHNEMLNLPPDEKQRMDYQVVTLRHQAFSQTPQFVSDRSYLDSMAYWINKLSASVCGCETDDFIGLCETLLFKECTHLIVLPFSNNVMRQWGEIEDNGKRITNPWYQFQITKIMDGLLEKMHYKISTERFMPALRYSRGFIRPHNSLNIEDDRFKTPTVKVLYLDHSDLETRMKTIETFLISTEDKNG